MSVYVAMNPRYRDGYMIDISCDLCEEYPGNKVHRNLVKCPSNLLRSGWAQRDGTEFAVLVSEENRPRGWHPEVVVQPYLPVDYVAVTSRLLFANRGWRRFDDIEQEVMDDGGSGGFDACPECAADMKLNSDVYDQRDRGKQGLLPRPVWPDRRAMGERKNFMADLRVAAILAEKDEGNRLLAKSTAKAAGRSVAMIEDPGRGLR